VALLGLVLAGVPVEAVALPGSLFYAWGMFIHSNLSLNMREIEPILITPRLHRVHHDPDTTGKNLGTLFTIWDRLRGTFVSRDVASNATFGVPGELDTYSMPLPSKWLHAYWR